MYINGNKLPYEYIVLMRVVDQVLHVLVHASIEISDDTVAKLTLGNGVIDILFDSKQSEECMYEIKRNMHYHIKYNKIDENSIFNFLHNHKDVLNKYTI
jgi:hypothetical protein